jgi:putative ABC transport system permease protein
MLSIVMGVAVGVAVVQATRSADSAFDRMSAALSGKADGEIVARGGGRYRTQLLAPLERHTSVETIVPSLRQTTVIYAAGQRVELLAVGVDLAQEMLVHDVELIAGRPCATADEAVLDEAVASSAHLKIGDELRMLTRSGRPQLTVVGLVRFTGTASFAQGGVIYTPLESLQRYSRAEGEINIAHLILPPHGDKQKALAEISRMMPEELLLRSANANSARGGATMAAFQQGLAFASTLALMASGLLIFNTFMMNVAERRGHLAVMRLLGMTRKQTLGLLLREGLLLGCVGAVLGWICGQGLSLLLADALRRVFGLPVPTLDWLAWTVPLALVLGMGVAAAAAYYPAWQASRIPALEGVRGRQGTAVEPHRGLMRPLLGGVLCVSAIVLAVLAALAVVPPNAAIVSAVVLLVGLVLQFPLVLRPLCRLAVAPLRALGHAQAEVALRQMLRHPGRTALTWSILFVSIAMSVSLGTVLMEIVGDVRGWIRQTIVTDFILRVSEPNLSTGTTTSLPDDLASQVGALAGVQMVEEIAFVPMDADHGRTLAILREFEKYAALPLELKASTAERDQIRRNLLDGDIVLSDMLSSKLKLKVGDRLAVQFAGRTRSLRVAGLARFYLLGGSGFYMDRQAALREFGSLPADALLITAQAGHKETLELKLRDLAAQRGLMFKTFATFEGMIQSLLDAVVGSLWGLLILGFLIAAFGITNTLMTHVLEQTRELGLMRVIGMTGCQVRRLILVQALLMGILSVVPGVLVGLVLASVLRIATLLVVGEFPDVLRALPWLAPYALVVMLLVTMFGWIPAARAARLKILDCIRTE